jgi:hypothetical protein
VLRQFQLISQHAAQQANGLFASRLARLWQEITGAACCSCRRCGRWPWPTRNCWTPGSCGLSTKASRRQVEQNCSACASWPVPGRGRALAPAGWVTQGYRLLLTSASNWPRCWPSPATEPCASSTASTPSRPAPLVQPAGQYRLAGQRPGAGGQVGWDNPHLLRWQLLTALYLQTAGRCAAAGPPAGRGQRPPPCAPRPFHPAEALIWPWHQRRPHRTCCPAAAHRRGRWRMAQAVPGTAGPAEPVLQHRAPGHASAGGAGRAACSASCC